MSKEKYDRNKVEKELQDNFSIILQDRDKIMKDAIARLEAMLKGDK